jgi:hypothetical protein
MHFTIQTLKFRDKTKKVNQRLKSQIPHIFQMVIDYGGFFAALDSQHLKMGGVGHIQIQKQKSQLGPNAHVTQKPQIFNILQTLHF